MSSSEKPPADTADEVNSKSKSDSLHSATKSTPHIAHHHNNDKTEIDKKQVNRASKFSQSDASIIKFDENATVKKKNHKPKTSMDSSDVAEAGLIAEMDSLNFNGTDGVEGNWVHSELVHARDSLENLNLSPRTGKGTVGDLGNSTSTNFPQEKFVLSETNPYSDSSLGNPSNEPSSSGTKSLTWDPWNRIGRKAKKETKRRKMAEKFQPQKPEEPMQISQSQEPVQEPHAPIETEELVENYDYQHFHHPLKTVEFTTDVMVVYFHGDEVVGESREPLKKEIEQQLRNKEMRKGHMPTMLGTKRKFPEDFRGAWF